MQKPPPGVPGTTLPPDGGWGWVIVVASGIASGFPAGFHRSVTLFYYELLKVFNQSATSTATVMSVDTVIGALTSPLAGALCNRFGCRLMAMMGGAFIALAFFTSAFVPKLFYFYFTFSILRGFGTTVFAVARISVVNLYFDRNKGKANAMSAMFYSLGSVYMAPLMMVLFSEYGLHGAMIICSALMLHIIPAAALFRPLPEQQPLPKEALGSVRCSGGRLVPRELDKPDKDRETEITSSQASPMSDLRHVPHEGLEGCEETLTLRAINEHGNDTQLSELGVVSRDAPEHGGCTGEVGAVTKGGALKEEGMLSQEGSGTESAAPCRQIGEIECGALPNKKGLCNHHEECPEETVNLSKIDKGLDRGRARSSGAENADIESQEKIINTNEEDSKCQLGEDIHGAQHPIVIDDQGGDANVAIQEEVTLLPPFPNIPDDNNMSPPLAEHTLHVTHKADMANEHCGTPVTTQCVMRQRSVLEQHPDPETIQCRVPALAYMRNAVRVFTGGVLQDSNFLLYCLFMSSYAYCHTMTFTFLSGLAIQKGCTIEQCTIAMAVMSGIEIPLRLSYGFGFDLKVVRPRRTLVFGVCGCVIGVLTCVLPLFPWHVFVLIIWAIQQAIAGVIVCQWSTVMSDILPRAQLTSGFGVLRFFMGVGSLLAPVSGGAMRDGSGSYSLVYYVAGAQLFILSVVFLIHDVRRRILERRQQQTTAT